MAHVGVRVLYTYSDSNRVAHVCPRAWQRISGNPLFPQDLPHPLPNIAECQESSEEEQACAAVLFH